MNTSNRVFSLMFALLTWPMRVAAHRGVLATLGGLDDRELADIGLSRQDLRDAGALPLASDPSDHLNRRARERAESSLPARRRYAAAGGAREIRGRGRVAAE